MPPVDPFGGIFVAVPPSRARPRMHGSKAASQPESLQSCDFRWWNLNPSEKARLLLLPWQSISEKGGHGFLGCFRNALFRSVAERQPDPRRRGFQCLHLD